MMVVGEAVVEAGNKVDYSFPDSFAACLTDCTAVVDCTYLDSLVDCIAVADLACNSDSGSDHWHRQAGCYFVVHL